MLTRVGFDKAVERGGIKRALEASKYDLPTSWPRSFYYALMLFVLSTAFGSSGTTRSAHTCTPSSPTCRWSSSRSSSSSSPRRLAAAAKALIENSLSGMSYAKVLGNVASGLILAFGVIAALDQLHVASNVVNAVLYAALAALVGVVVVAVGGGGIRTMSRRWEAVADTYDEEKPKIAESVRNAPSIKDQARQAKDTVSPQYGNGTQSPDGSGGRTAPPASIAPLPPASRALTPGAEEQQSSRPRAPPCRRSARRTHLKEHGHDYHPGTAEHGRPDRRRRQRRQDRQIGQIYVDDQTSQPLWVTITTGMFGTKQLRPAVRLPADGMTCSSP